MKKWTHRRLLMEALETRLLLDGAGLGAPPAAAAWEQVIVSLREDVADPRAVGQGVVNQHGGRLGHVYEHALKGFSAQLPAAAVAALQRNPAVKAVEADIPMQTFGQTVPTGVRRIGADPAKAPAGDLSSVNIAILDTGIDENHPDLNVAGGTRFYTVTSGPPFSRGSFQDDNWNDENGHGTHVAGTAAAIDNGFGVVGVAPGATLWSVRVLGANGSGFMQDIIAGVDWVTATRMDGNPGNDIHVANMSLGGTGWSEALYTAIQNSVDAGVVYVVSAGNNGRDIHGSDKKFGTSDDTIPAAFPQVATISAFGDSDGLPGGTGGSTSWGPDDMFANFSNFSNSDGTENQHFLDANVAILEENRHKLGLGIDLTLPGVDIYSTYRGGGYATMSGTSMAAPHAAGLAARHIAEKEPATDAGGVYEIRRALIDSGKRWRDEDYGLILDMKDGGNQDSPDKYEENLGWAVSTPLVQLPTVEITAPTGGAVAGTVTVTVAVTSVAPDNPVRGVELFVGGDLLVSGPTGSDNDGNWSFEWDTMAVADGQPLYPDGSYTVTAVATTQSDHEVSDSIVLEVDNVDDPPEVRFIAPAGGETLAGIVTITVEATDDRGIDKVEFLVDDDKIGEGVRQNGTDFWSIEWDTMGTNGEQPLYPDGPYTLAVRATDSDGQSDEDSLNVLVNNSVAMMIASLEGWPTSVNRNFWRANVTVTARDSNGVALSNAVVTGHWNSNGSPVSATTDSSGEVSFSTGNLSKNNVDSIDFTVTAVDLAGYEYEGSDAIRIHQNGSTAPLATNANVPVILVQSTEPASPRNPDEARVVEASVDYLMALDDQQDFSVGQTAGRNELVLASVRPGSNHSDVFDDDLTAFLPEL